MKSLLRRVIFVFLLIVLPIAAIDGYAQGTDEAAGAACENTVAPTPEATEVAIPAETAEPTATPVETAAPEATVAPAETVAPDATVIPEETIAPEAGIDPAGAENLMSLLAPDRSARISASWTSEHLGVGDAVSLSAVIKGYESVRYDLIWQSSADGVQWVDQARGGSSFTYTLSADNYGWMWRVVVVIYAPAQQ